MSKDARGLVSLRSDFIKFLGNSSIPLKVFELAELLVNNSMNLDEFKTLSSNEQEQLVKKYLISVGESSRVHVSLPSKEVEISRTAFDELKRKALEDEGDRD